MPSKPPEFVERLLDDEFGCGGSFCYCDMHRRTAFEPTLAFLRAVLRECKLRPDEESVVHTEDLIRAMSAGKLLAWAEADEEEET